MERPPPGGATGSTALPARESTTLTAATDNPLPASADIFARFRTESPPSTYKEIRKICVEAILHTDMTMLHGILTMFPIE